MTTDSFPLRLDTSTGVIKFIETDSDDLIVLAAKCGEYLADIHDSTSKGWWELKGGTGDDGFVGTIQDTYWNVDNTDGASTTSSYAISTDTYYLGLVTTQNVNQKSPPSGDALVYPLRYDRTLGGLQEIGDSGGSDPAYTTVQDAILSLIYQHDLPGVYRMAASYKHTSSPSDHTVLSTFADVQAEYLDSDEWRLVLNLDQEFDNASASLDDHERVRIYQKTGITAGSATDTLIKSKRPDGGLRLLKRRNIGAIFLGVGVMAGNDETSTNLEMQEFFAGGLLNRLMDNQGQNRPGHFQITTSATPPAGYRNLGKYQDLRKAVVDNGGLTQTIGGNGGESTGGSYTGNFTNRVSRRSQRRQGQLVNVFPNQRQNQRSRGTFRQLVNYTNTFTQTLSNQSYEINAYYLHVKI